MPAAGAGERALPPRAVGAGGRGPGRRRAHRLGDEADRAGPLARSGARRRGRDRRGRRDGRRGHRRRRRRRQQPDRGARDRRRRPARDLLSRAGRLARRARRRRARRRRAASSTVSSAEPRRRRRRPPGRTASPTCPRPTPPTPSGASSSARSSTSPRAPACRRRCTSPRIATRSLLLRDGSGAWPAVLARMGVDPTTRVARPAAGRLPGVAGRLRRRAAAAAGAHGARRRRRPPPRARRRRHRGALCAFQSAHHRRAARRRRAASPTASAWRSAPTAWRRRRISRRGARSRRWPSASRSVAPATWLDAATRGGADAMELAPLGSLTPGKRPGIIEVMPHTVPQRRIARSRAGERPAPGRPLEGALTA